MPGKLKQIRHPCIGGSLVPDFFPLSWRRSTRFRANVSGPINQRPPVDPSLVEKGFPLLSDGGLCPVVTEGRRLSEAMLRMCGANFRLREMPCKEVFGQEDDSNLVESRSRL